MSPRDATLNSKPAPGRPAEPSAVEKALRESEARYRTLAENSGVGIWQLDSTGHSVYLNPMMAAMLELDNAAEVNGTHFSKFFPPDSLEVVQAEQLKRQQGFATSYEVELLGSRGRRLNVLVSGAPLLGPDGQLAGMIGTFVDVTNHRRAERELRESQQARRESQARLQAFLDHSPAVIFVKDVAGRYSLVNQRFAEVFGIPAVEVIGRTDTELFSAEQAAGFRANDERVVISRKMLEFEELATYCDGRLHISLVQKFPLFDDAGTVIAVGGVATDVTERITSRDALRRSEERFRTLVESARDVIFTLDTQGVITSVNAACEPITGWKPEEWIGRAYSPLVYAEDQPLAQARYEQLLQGERPDPYELRVVNKDGSLACVEVTVTPLVEDGRVAGLLGIARDVHERKQLEAELRQVQKMESIGQLAGGVAHDFNNILTVIQGHATLIEMTPGLSGDLAESIDQISRAAERAANLTRQLLAFSRRQLLRTQAVDLNGVVVEMGKMLQRILGEDISLHLVAAPDLPLVSADASMIGQVLMNLAVNARDAMRGGGRLTISTEVVEAAPETPRGGGNRSCVRLSVSDTGCGIEPEDLPRIFEPFFTTKDVGHGTGLGLATVYGIVQQHRGWIDVESQPGRGTTFHIMLPALALGTPDKPIVPDVPKPSGGNETILVVEDESSVRVLVRGLLERLGYRVFEAVSGIAALDVWERHRSEIDLLLTDMVMPDGMTGRQLAEWLQSQEPKLPVIYTSGYSPETVSGDFPLREGVNFLQKPYRPQRLSEVIRAALDGPVRA